MHNYYAFLYNKVTFEVLERSLGKNNAALFARSATAGCQVNLMLLGRHMEMHGKRS
jgi:alpha-glucosidase (family GH31 glycosyl hydrolase)